jgi:hypothetical protein
MSQNSLLSYHEPWMTVELRDGKDLERSIREINNKISRNIS